MHPYSEKFVARDYCFMENASLSGRIRRQGLFSRSESIPIRRNSSPGIIFPRRMHPYSKNSLSGIIFPRRMHPYSENFAAKDYCSMKNASLTSYFVESGCLPPSKCIPDRVFLQIRMHSSAGKQTSLQRTYPSSESQFSFLRITSLPSQGVGKSS